MIAGHQTEIAFVLTIGVEYLVLLALLRRDAGALLLYTVLVNALTWPIATVVYRSTSIPYWSIEAVVWLVESVLLKLFLRTGYRQAAWLSLAANLSTALPGWLAQGRFSIG